MEKRFKKQIMLSEVGIEGQERLRKARLLVVGCGGLGNTVLPLLSAAGIGFIRVYDHDIVEESNLHRQYMYSKSDLGKHKVLVMQNILYRQNPECHIEAYAQKLSFSYISDAMRGIDLVIDAADNFMVTYLLSDKCYEMNIPFISASVLEFQGYVGAFCGGGPSYRSVFPKPSFSNNNCNNIGVMGPVVAIMGSIQAEMAINIIIKLSKPTLGNLFHIDCINWRVGQICFDDAEEPEQKTIISLLDRESLKVDDYLVELRDEIEAPISVNSHVIRVKPENIENSNFPTDRRIIFICKTGIRAIKAAYQLQFKGYTNLGIIAD